MFYYIFITIWAFDLFFYSNTEIFLIFFIFSCLFIFFYFIFMAYLDYLNELVVSENYSIYFKLHVLKYKFSSILNHSNKHLGIRGNESNSIVIRHNNFATLRDYTYIFFEFCFYILVCKFKFMNYIKFFKFVKNSLVGIHRVEFFGIKDQVFLDFSSNFSKGLVTIGISLNNYYFNTHIACPDVFLVSNSFLEPDFVYLFCNFTVNLDHILFNNLPVFLFKNFCLIAVYNF